MASPEEQQPMQEPAAPQEQEVSAPEPAAALPDYLTDSDAVMKDVNASWRYGRPPDYSKTRKVWAETKKMSHEAGSLPQLVENLVKNWEVEASFKPVLSDWRTIDHANYSFAINGGPPQSAEHMLKVGTYNAIIAPNQYYCPAHSSFDTSHKTFKRMMPTFAWEVLEVYSGPPTVAFRWRHWGVMKNDYVGFNDKGEKVTVKAHGGSIDVQGVTVATVDDKVRLQSVMTWFDPMEMFRQIAPNGIVNKEIVDHKVDKANGATLDNAATGEQQKVDGVNGAEPIEHLALPDGHPEVAQSMFCPILHTLDKAKQQVQELEASLSHLRPTAPLTPASSKRSSGCPVSGHANFDARIGNATADTQSYETDNTSASYVEVPYPHPHTTEEQVQPAPGDAVAGAEKSTETIETKAEMGKTTADERNGFLNME